MSDKRNEILSSLAETLADYRQGEIEPRTPKLIDAWVQQFPDTVQLDVLSALSNVFKKTYISKKDFKGFLGNLVKGNKISPGSVPAQYWRAANFLDTQKGGNSQTELLALADEVLTEIHSFGIDQTGSDDGQFIYLDDCIGTGSRVRSDVCGWVESTAPKVSVLHVISPVLYLGSWWIDDKIQETAKAAGKTVSLTKWSLESYQMENRMARREIADVLWPTRLPSDPAVQAYVKRLVESGHPPALRKGGNGGASGIFTDDAEKIVLEQAFLLRGCEIRQESSNLPDKARPLGYHNLDCLGFGSMFVTYRNCPNNCPIALWVQQAEYPALLPRKTNKQSATERVWKGFFS
jgi:hypothetical protein